MDGSDERQRAGTWHFAGIGLAMFLVIVIAAVAVAKANVAAPEIGDIIALRAATVVPRPLRVELPARRLDGAGGWTACLLGAEVMARTGGSVVVEARRSDETASPSGPAYAVQSYVVHWAGGPTSDAANDCGSAADLEVTASDLTRLAQIAGGFGVNPNRLPRGVDMAELQAIGN